jgi:mannose-6-phosphate isomerase-like protein (cupin superfamily)
MANLIEREAVVHDLHGARFSSYVAPSSGSTELCAWRVAVAPGVAGQEHRISREEVFLVLSGSPTLALDGVSSELTPGRVVLAPAGARVRLDNPGGTPAELWVTTSVGLEAELADGSSLSPPWTR